MNLHVQKQTLKIACLAFAIFSTATVANAQRLSTAAADFVKNSNAAPGVLNGSVRVVDNKGTVKYLQTANGLTTITNTMNNVTTTTWQLGGALTDDTYIDVTGKVFALDGLELATAGSASTNATANSKAGTGPGTGWTLLVRDEATGATKKLLATDLITSGQTVFKASAGQTDFDVTTTSIPMAGAQIPLPSFSKVWVYRNGIKLLAGVDYTIAGSKVTLNLTDYTTSPVPTATTDAIAAGTDWTVYAGDIIEVQYIK